MAIYFSIVLILTAILLALYVGYVLKTKADKPYEKFVFSGLFGYTLVLVALGICLCRVSLLTNSAVAIIMSLVLSLSAILVFIGLVDLRWNKSKQELRQAMLEEFRHDLGLNIPVTPTPPSEVVSTVPATPVAPPAVNPAPVKPATPSADPNARPTPSVRPARIPLPSQLPNGQVEINGVIYEPVVTNKPSSPPPANPIQ